LHNRLPVILPSEAWPAWLGEEPADVPQLKALLAPYPSEEMICWPVSARIGNVKNNDPSLIEPIFSAISVCRAAQCTRERLRPPCRNGYGRN
jgi:putative SOS response-associated peptidase YedK